MDEPDWVRRRRVSVSSGEANVLQAASSPCELARRLKLRSQTIKLTLSRCRGLSSLVTDGDMDLWGTAFPAFPSLKVVSRGASRPPGPRPGKLGSRLGPDTDTVAWFR